AARAGAEGVLAQSGEVGVVVDGQRHAELVPHAVEETGTAPAGQVDRVAHAVVLLVVHTRGRDHRLDHALAFDAALGDDLVGGGDHEVGHGGRGAGPVAYVGAGDDRAVQVGEGNPQPVAPDVDTQRVSRGRIGRVEHGDPAAFGGL